MQDPYGFRTWQRANEGYRTPQQMAAMQQRKAMAMQQQQQMNRDGTEGEMNGVRPGTPTAGDDGGSPSKRPRIDNGQPAFNNGMMQNGRPGGVPGVPQQGMMIQAGFNPRMNPQFQQNGTMPPKGMQVRGTLAHEDGKLTLYRVRCPMV